MSAIMDPITVDQNTNGPEVSREEILKQIFGDIGTLIEDFSCAVESTVLLHGRMYITTKFICFYSNLFGLEKKIRIPYSHIKNISKENTAMVIPNAIAISTDKKDYVFRSFWDREECYKMLSNFLERYRTGQNLLDYRKLPTAPSVTVSHRSDSTASASSITLLANLAADAASSNTNNHTANTNNTTTAPTAAPSDSQSDHNSTTPVDRRGSRKLSVNGLVVEDGFEDTESGFRSDSRPASTNITGDMSLNFALEVGKAKLKLVVIDKETLDISLKDFESLFLAEQAPYGFKRYHESVKDTNVVMSAWSEPSPGLGVGREMKFFKPVNLPGLASTRGVKIQRLRKFGTVGLLLYSVTKLEDVPAADTFSVDDILAITAVDGGKVTVEINFQVTFLKNTYMKFLIERSTNAEMTKWLEAYFQHLRKTVELFKDGKISLSPPTTTDSLPPPPDPIPALEPIVEEKKKSMVEDILSALLDFNNATLGDRLKTLLVLLLCVFLAQNIRTWQETNEKISSLEQSVKNLQEMMKLMKIERGR